MQQINNDRVNSHWIFKKHKESIEVMSLSYAELRKEVNQKGYSLLDDKFLNSTIFDWLKIKPSYNFWFNYLGCELEIELMLKNSTLMNSKYVYIETDSDIPIYKVSVINFINNWFDYIKANCGMGSIVVSDDFKFLIEFTDDSKYLLFSNFIINPNSCPQTGASTMSLS